MPLIIKNTSSFILLIMDRELKKKTSKKPSILFLAEGLGLRGLGLSYAQKVIELHNGAIQIKTEDKKTLVIVRLPLNQDRKSRKTMLFK